MFKATPRIKTKLSNKWAGQQFLCGPQSIIFCDVKIRWNSNFWVHIWSFRGTPSPTHWFTYLRLFLSCNGRAQPEIHTTYSLALYRECLQTLELDKNPHGAYTLICILFPSVHCCKHNTLHTKSGPWQACSQCLLNKSVVPFTWLEGNNKSNALSPGVAQLIGHCQLEGCRFNPHLGACRKQPIHVPLSNRCFSFSLPSFPFLSFSKNQ